LFFVLIAVCDCDQLRAQGVDDVRVRIAWNVGVLEAIVIAMVRVVCLLHSRT
jgi:hypothetical protein